MDNGQAYLALGGGAGTLAEISLTWNSLIVSALSPRPLVLIGPAWQATFDQLFNSLDGYVTPRDRKLLTFVPNIESAVELVNKFNSQM